MNDKNNIVVGVGLVVMIFIAFTIAQGNRESTEQLTKQLNSEASVAIMQKETVIKKLIKQLKAKEAELEKVKVDLSDTKAKLDSIKITLSAPPPSTAK